MVSIQYPHPRGVSAGLRASCPRIVRRIGDWRSASGRGREGGRSRSRGLPGQHWRRRDEPDGRR